MRHAPILAALLAYQATPALAGAQGEMQQQRCVWACLANSSGNEDPRYHSCVEKRCVKRPRRKKGK